MTSSEQSREQQLVLASIQAYHDDKLRRAGIFGKALQLIGHADQHRTATATVYRERLVGLTGWGVEHAELKIELNVPENNNVVEHRVKVFEKLGELCLPYEPFSEIDRGIVQSMIDELDEARNSGILSDLSPHLDKLTGPAQDAT